MRKKFNLRFMESLVLSPFILAIQPVLQLFALNIEELVFRDVIRPTLIMLLLAVLLVGVLFLILRDWIKAGLIASMFFPLFFGFGEIAKWVETTTGLTFLRSNALALLVVSAWLFLWFLVVTRWAGGLNSINLYFNLISIVFLINPALRLADSLYQSVPSIAYESPSSTAIANSNEQPDVYYIILDGYGRQDILQELYGFDNSNFTAWLTAKGFYVAEQSNSNYIQTALSMSSSLNMDYVQNMIAEDESLRNRLALVNAIHHSEVRRILAGQGYQLISFQNSYKVSIPDADIYYDDTDKGFGRPVTAFEGILIDQSMMRILLSWPVFKNFFIEAPYEMHREQILSTYERLQEVPTLDGNYFVYAHIIAPHPPFVFGPDGEILPHEEPFTLDDANYFIRDHTRRGYISGYRRQIEYVNKLTMETIEQILSNSKTPPIIIIQGDHGPGAYLQWGSLDNSIPQERFGILNAYYFPGQNYGSLYPSISPINSFRMVLDEYFGQEFELLPDKHYFSGWGTPFDFIEVDGTQLTPAK
jgi:hypothetical protein